MEHSAQSKKLFGFVQQVLDTLCKTEATYSEAQFVLDYAKRSLEEHIAGELSILPIPQKMDARCDNIQLTVRQLIPSDR